MKQWHEYTNEEKNAIEDNKSKYIDSYLKVVEKIEHLQTKLKHADILYQHPENKKISLNKKINKLSNDQKWLQSKIDECDNHIKIYKQVRSLN